MKRILVLVMVILFAAASAQAQNCSRAKRAAKRGGIMAGIGAGLGALLNSDHKAGAVQGAIAGGIVGATSAAIEPCTDTREPRTRRANDNPHRRRVARANELPAHRDELVPIYVRTINGADDSALRGALPNVFHPNGYGYVDPSDPSKAQFTMDITVKDVSHEQRGGSDSSFWGYFGLNKYGNKQRRTFKVMITTFQNGVSVPELTAEEIVDVVSYEDNGTSYQFAIYQRNRYESYYLTDPAAEAAAWTVDYIFGLRTD